MLCRQEWEQKKQLWEELLFQWYIIENYFFSFP